MHKKIKLILEIERFFEKSYSFSLLLLTVLIGVGGNFVFCEEGKEAVLDIKGIVTVNHVLAGDTAGVKDKGEAIYLIKGEAIKAPMALKKMLIEHKQAPRSFKTRDLVNVIIFRSVLESFGKIEIIKIVSKDRSFEVYTKYLDIADPKIPSEPAAVIPLGKLPAGKYSISLYVGDQLHKKTGFSVTR